MVVWKIIMIFVMKIVPMARPWRPLARPWRPLGVPMAPYGAPMAPLDPGNSENPLTEFWWSYPKRYV